MGLYSAAHVAALAEALREVLPAWGMGGAAVTLLSVSENATFRVAAPGAADLVLRVHRPGYHGRAEIASELAWIRALRAAGTVTTPAVRPARDGRDIVDLPLRDGGRFVVGFDFAPGAEPAPGADLVQRFADLGQISARLHAQAQVWGRPSGFTRKRWTFDTCVGQAAAWGSWRAALGLTPAGAAVLARVETVLATRLAEWGQRPDRFGLIHADLRLANLLVTESGLTVIDFDDCGFGWYLFDFAAAVSFHEEDPALPVWQAAWVRGYRQVSTLPPASVAMLPTFVMLRRLQLTAWVASHAETPTAAALGADYTQGTVRLAERYLAG